MQTCSQSICVFQTKSSNLYSSYNMDFVANNLSKHFCREGMSLSALSQQVLGITMDKDWKIRCSDWEAPQLSERQIEYAANDAVVAVQIFFKLTASKLRERESRIEAAKNQKDEAIVPQTDEICSENEKSAQSSDATCPPTESSENTDKNNFIKVTCEDKATSILSATNSNVQLSNKNGGQNNISASDSPISEALVDNGDANNMTGCSSEEGVISSFVSTIKTSFGSVLGMQSEPKETGKVHHSKHKIKNYTQYESFKILEVNDDLFSSPEFWSCITPLCHGIVDVPYKIKAKHKGGGKAQSNEKSKPGSSSQTSNKVSGLKPRRAPLYQNCVIEAPDGEMLSTCDKRKAEWYLCRNLGKCDRFIINVLYQAIKCCELRH